MSALVGFVAIFIVGMCKSSCQACIIWQNTISGGCSRAPECSNAGKCTEEYKTCRQTHQTKCRGCFRGAPNCPAGWTADPAHGDLGEAGWSCDALCCRSVCYQEHVQKCGKTGCCNSFICPYGMEKKSGAGSFAGSAFLDLCCREVVGLCRNILCEAGYVKKRSAASHSGVPTNSACCEEDTEEDEEQEEEEYHDCPPSFPCITRGMLILACCGCCCIGSIVIYVCCDCDKPKQAQGPDVAWRTHKLSQPRGVAPQPTRMGSGLAAPSAPAESCNAITVKVTCGSCRQIAKVSGATNRCRYTCPSCGAFNEFQVAGISQEVAQDIPVQYPPYWKTQNADGSSFLHDTDDVKKAMQVLLDKTWKDRWTRDRGKDSVICKYEAITVIRNENPKLWTEYYKAREQLAMKLDSSTSFLWDDVKTQALTRGDPHTTTFFEKAALRREVNEFYLFHGTNPSAAKRICDDDFLLTKAGSNVGTLYGPGIYLAEASSKADEYATDDSDGIFQGHYAMLVCRVVCGSMRYSDEVNPPVQDLVDSILSNKTHHSIMGDREKCRGTYREFIVFDSRQVYPEYVIIYKRSSRE